MNDLSRPREPIVDLAGLEAAVLANQARDVSPQPAAPSGSKDIAAAIKQLDGELPEAVTRMCSAIDLNFGATANAMLNNAELLRRQADLLVEAARTLQVRGTEATAVLKDAVAFERRAAAMNRAAALLGERVAPERS